MSLTVDRKKFWELYRKEFGTSPQPTVDGLNFFLDRFENENRLQGTPQFSYVLTTAYHESGKNQIIDGEKVFVRFQPVKETRERSSSPRRANQDRYWNTGFYGRGFPQTTWKRNYLASGQALGLGDLFVKNPDLLLQPNYAYDAMIICMVKGIYTGKKLSDYISDTGKDYEAARRVINGQDRAALLADIAEKFESILRASKTNSAAAQPASKPNGEQPTVTATDKGNQSISDEQPLDFTGGAAIVPPVGDPPPSLVAVQTPVVEVEQVKPEQEATIDKTIMKWSARYVAIPAGVFSFFAAVWGWITSGPTQVVVTLFLVSGAVAVIYILSKQVAIVLENSRKDRLQADREQRAHEIQKMTLESAMNKDMNTVRVVPQPLVNSDNPANEVVQ